MNELSDEQQSKEYRDYRTTDWWWIHSEFYAKSFPAYLSLVDTAADIRDGALDVFQ